MKAAPVALWLAFLLGFGCEARGTDFQTVRVVHLPRYRSIGDYSSCMRLGEYLDGTVSFAAGTITGSRVVPCIGIPGGHPECIKLDPAGPLWATKPLCELCRGWSTEERLGAAQLAKIEALTKAILEAAEGAEYTPKYRGGRCRLIVSIDGVAYAANGENAYYDDKILQLETYLDQLPLNGDSIRRMGRGSR